MRQIVLDTETTGLEPSQGHRIIEIGCVEIVDRRITGNRFHRYLNPERDIEEGAVRVHGITLDELRSKPRFADIVEEFLDFVRGAELVIHNADFDIAFLDHELKRLGDRWGSMADHCTVLDTLKLARELHPGQRNSLDALCRRYGVDASERELHGALLDARLLAEVYLAMTGGQAALTLETETAPATQTVAPGTRGERPPLRVVRASPEELEAHRRRMAAIDEASGGRAVWKP